MSKLSKISPFNTAFLLSLTALGAAFTSQYAFGAAPCDLCIYQRYPYAFIIVIALIACVVKPQKLPSKLMIYLIMCGFLTTALIATYHVGVEQGLVNEPNSCATNAFTAKNIEELKAAILSAPKVSCKQVKLSFLGLSMAAWNAIYSAIAIIIVRKIWRKTQN
jgi:disulfide bond formation protein DsbB